MQTNSSSISNRRRMAGNILLRFGGMMLLLSAALKIAHVPPVVRQLGALGFDGNKLMFIAALEIVSAILFLVPLTRSFGLLMVSAYLGGAIAAHVGHDQPFIQPAIVLAILWLGVWLRYPLALASFAHRWPSLAGGQGRGVNAPGAAAMNPAAGR